SPPRAAVRRGTVGVFSYVTHSFVDLTECAVAESLCEAVSTALSDSPDYISALASLHLFACVIATLPRHLRRFDALAIQGSCRWMFMATGTLTYLRPECVRHSLPGAIIAPVPKVARDPLPGRILPWE